MLSQPVNSSYQLSKSPGIILSATFSTSQNLNNSIENVANTLVEILDNPKTFKKVISMHDGDTPIKDAIADR